MHLLHDYIAKQLANKLKSRRVVVWYDARSEFTAFVAELRGEAKVASTLAHVLVAGMPAKLVEYTGSMFELRAVVEPSVSADSPECVLIYLPGCERDLKGSVIMELQKAGECAVLELRSMARNAFRERYTDGVIDELTASDALTYEDLVRASSGVSTAEPPSILKNIFPKASGGDDLLIAWLVSENKDGEIVKKEGYREIRKLVRSRLELDLPDDDIVQRHRAIVARYLLINEFRSDYSGEPIASLAAIPKPNTEAGVDAVRALLHRFRSQHADQYAALADGIEALLHLTQKAIAADQLGSINTFRFEERALLKHCNALIADRRFEVALKMVEERERTFWVDRDVSRKAQWDVCRLMCNVGAVSATISKAIVSFKAAPSAWIESYEREWYRVDTLHRHLETRARSLDEEPDERALGIVRRAYEDTCGAMATGFVNALQAANWSIGNVLQQTHIFSDIVSAQPKPVAYFFVDAMRYEMGAELASTLPKSSEVSLRPAVAVLPTITPIGMAALLPGASSSFSLAVKDGKLGSSIDDALLVDLAARKKHAAARIPNSVDMTLEELLGYSKAKLETKLDGVHAVIVRSQDIDLVGESGLYHARQIMDSVIGNLSRAVGKLARVGVERCVISADHGHLFASDRDESMRIDAPGGETVDLHRRCWVGRGGSKPSGCVRVAAAQLGYASDLDLVFPVGCGVFKSGGDLSFHHGGPTLQEMIVPVLTVLTKAPAAERNAQSKISVVDFPKVITNRIFRAKIQCGDANLAMFAEQRSVRPVLVSGDKQVGSVFAVIEGTLDDATGCVMLTPNTSVMVAFLLSDDSAQSLRVVIQDPSTAAEIFRSAAEIPVQLGV